jgi:O-methyltransferase involved in polyketide biosynthesis
VLDTSAPNIARAYDYLLGGRANFAADRALAGRVLAACPRAAELLSASRTYAADSLTHIARQGSVDQYLDLGSGLPTRPSTHEVIRPIQPHARVIYADRDPAVVAHATALVPPPVRVIEADLAEPEALLAALPGFIDLSRPLCLILTMVLQVLDPPTARAVVGVLVRAVPPGSYLVLSVGAGESGRLPDAVAPGGFTADDVTSFLGGLDLVPPGIRQGAVLCGTGVKPAGHG